jgi:hypothetical protein
VAAQIYLDPRILLVLCFILVIVFTLNNAVVISLLYLGIHGLSQSPGFAEECIFGHGQVFADALLQVCRSVYTWLNFNPVSNHK